MSKPLGFWTKQDILRYLVINEIEIAEPYGNIVEIGQIEGQLSFCSNCKLTTTGESRTGCMFCPIGCHLDNFAKFKRLKKFNPKLYDYCMEELGEKKLLNFINKYYVRKD